MTDEADDIERIRQLYVTTDTPLYDIRELTGVSPARISEMARTHKWGMRKDRQKLARQEAAKAKLAAAKLETGGQDAAKLLERIQKIIDDTATQMQRRASIRKTPTAQDDERQMRAMAGLIRNLEKVAELKMKVKSPGGSTPQADVVAVKEAQKHAEQLRQDITERIDRLQRQRDARRAAE